MSQYNRGIYTKMDIRTILGASEKKKIPGPHPIYTDFLGQWWKSSFKELTWGF